MWYESLIELVKWAILAFGLLAAFFLGVKAGRGEALEIKKPKPRVHIQTPEGEAAAYDRQQQKDRHSFDNLKAGAIVNE